MVEILKREMPSDYVLHDTGDFHVGSVNCHYDGIMELVRTVKNSKNHFIVIKGDFIEAKVPQSSHFSFRSFDPDLKTVEDQAERVIELLRPVKDQVIGCCVGNHEIKLINELDVVGYICKGLGIYRYSYGAGVFKFHALKKGKVAHKMFFTHGRRGLPKGAKDPIQKIANKKAAQKNILENRAISDVIYASQGHHHELLVVEPIASNMLSLNDDGQNIKQHYRVSVKQNADYIPSEYRWYAGTGSYRKQYTKPGLKMIDYSELADFSPSVLGHAVLTIKDHELIKVEEYKSGNI